MNTISTKSSEYILLHLIYSIYYQIYQKKEPQEGANSDTPTWTLWMSVADGPWVDVPVWLSLRDAVMPFPLNFALAG